jgi:hypothetical protein
MNREKAQEILKAFGRPVFKVGDTNVAFLRQTEDDLNDIESQSDQELIDHWKSLVWVNEIFGQVSLNDMQRISLLELEMTDRNISFEPLKLWFDSESNNFENQNSN